MSAEQEDNLGVYDDLGPDDPPTAEQGDVERPWASQLIARNRELQAALERAERERDDALGERVIAQLDIAQARAEKAERALAEIAAGKTARTHEEVARAALCPSEESSDES